jgi:hypothetical protein
VDFIVNASYPLVLDWLSKASIGLSTMVDEHFGINVVEFMVSGAFFSLGLGPVLIVFLSQAAGVIPVAHASGGPLKDIIVPFNGENTGMYSNLPQFCSTHSDHYSSHSCPEQDSMRVLHKNSPRRCKRLSRCLQKTSLQYAGVHVHGLSNGFRRRNSSEGGTRVGGGDS